MWISLTPLLLLLSPCQGVKTSCEIPEVEEGHDTTLTCKFSDDVRKLQQDYKVHFYRDNTTAVHDTVLDCVWLNNEPECRVNHCCIYDRNVSNTLQVLVRKVTADNVGRYVCFVLPASQDSYEFCNFSLKIKETKLVEGSSNTLGALGVLAIIPIVIVIVIVISIVIVIILIWKCNKCPKKKDGSEMCKWDPCRLCKKGNDDSQKNSSQHSGNISIPEKELLLLQPAGILTCKKDNDDSKENNSQHSGNILIPEKELLLLQPVGEAQKQTDSCEPTVKHKLEQGTEEGANTTEDISDIDNIKIRDIDGHSKLTQKRLEGNDAQTATQESDLSMPSAGPLQKPGDDTTDSKPHAAKRIPPLVTNESGGKSHVLMLPQNTKQRKKGGRFWKSAGAMNNPQKALIKQYNRTAEEEEANRSKNELEKKRSSKARKTLEQSKGGKSSKKTESVPPIINVESSQQSHIGAFSESLSLPQSSSSVNDNCTDISKTTVINRDEHSNADSSTEPRNTLQDNNPTHGTNVSSCEIDLGTCTSTNDSEDSTGLTVQSGPRQPCTSSETAKEFTVTLNEFEQEVYGEETKPKPKNRILNVMRFGSKGGKNKTKGMKPKDMATPQEP